MMDKIILLLLILTASISCVNGQEKPPASIPRAPFEPYGIDPQKINDAEFNYTVELEAYADETYERIMKYLEEIDEKPSSTIKDSIIGYWRLEDAQGSYKESHGPFDSTWRFDIIIFDEELYILLPALPQMKLYISNNTDIYFVTTYGILKKIIISDDALYIYVLYDDLWYLDRIHENGKFFYQKHPPRDIIRP